MSKDNQPPHLRLAVENDQRELDRRGAEFDLRWPLKRLAANTFRVVRGAGRPEEIGRQCADVVQAFRAYHERLGEWPSSFLISEILSIREREYHAKTDRAWEWEDGIRQMVAGGLQVAASQLLEQRTQEQAGQRELFSGFEVIERQRSENWAAASKKKPTKGRKTPKDDIIL